jgi:hypothetical protein
MIDFQNTLIRHHACLPRAAVMVSSPHLMTKHNKFLSSAKKYIVWKGRMNIKCWGEMFVSTGSRVTVFILIPRSWSPRLCGCVCVCMHACVSVCVFVLLLTLTAL